MRQTFDETTDPSFGPRHVPLIRQAMADQGLDGILDELRYIRRSGNVPGNVPGTVKPSRPGEQENPK